MYMNSKVIQQKSPNENGPYRLIFSSIFIEQVFVSEAILMWEISAVRFAKHEVGLRNSTQLVLISEWLWNFMIKITRFFVWIMYESLKRQIYLK